MRDYKELKDAILRMDEHKIYPNNELFSTPFDSLEDAVGTIINTFLNDIQVEDTSYIPVNLRFSVKESNKLREYIIYKTITTDNVADIIDNNIMEIMTSLTTPTEAGYEELVQRVNELRNKVRNVYTPSSFGTFESGNQDIDCAIAINLAITEASTNNGIVYIPKGTWYIKSPIISRTGVTLQGDGQSKSTIKVSNMIDAPLSAIIGCSSYDTSSSGNTNYGMRVYDLGLDGNTKNGAYCADFGVDYECLYYSQFERIKIVNINYWCVRVRGYFFTTDVNNIDCRQAFGGILAAGVTNGLKIRNCTFFQLRGYGVGIAFDTQNLGIKDNTFEQIGRSAIYISAPGNGRIENNYFESCSMDGIKNVAVVNDSNAVFPVDGVETHQSIFISSYRSGVTNNYLEHTIGSNQYTILRGASNGTPIKRSIFDIVGNNVSVDGSSPNSVLVTACGLSDCTIKDNKLRSDLKGVLGTIFYATYTRIIGKVYINNNTSNVKPIHVWTSKFDSNYTFYTETDPICSSADLPISLRGNLWSSMLFKVKGTGSVTEVDDADFKRAFSTTTKEVYMVFTKLKELLASNGIEPLFWVRLRYKRNGSIVNYNHVINLKDYDEWRLRVEAGDIFELPSLYIMGYVPKDCMVFESSSFNMADELTLDKVSLKNDTDVLINGVVINEDYPNVVSKQIAATPKSGYIDVRDQDGSRGSVASSATAEYTELTNLEGVKYLRFTGIYPKDSSSFSSGYAFYNDMGVCMSYNRWQYNSNLSATTTKEYFVKVPDGAVSFRTTSKSGAYLDGTFRLYTYSDIKRKTLSTALDIEVQLNEPAIYTIKNDFDLGGRTIKIPEGSTLVFDGGCLKNGTIDSTGLTIEETDKVILFNITFAKNIKVYGKFVLENFGATGDGTTDDAEAFKLTIENCSKSRNVIRIPARKNYYIGHGVVLDDGDSAISVNIQGEYPVNSNGADDIKGGFLIDNNPLFELAATYETVTDDESGEQSEVIKAYHTLFGSISNVGIRSRNKSNVDSCVFKNMNMNQFTMDGCVVSKVNTIMLDVHCEHICQISHNSFYDARFFARKDKRAYISFIDSVVDGNYITGGLGDGIEKTYCFGWSIGEGSLVVNNFIDYYRTIFYADNSASGYSKVVFPQSRNNQYQVFRNLYRVARYGNGFVVSFVSVGDRIAWTDETRSRVKDWFTKVNEAEDAIPQCTALMRDEWNVTIKDMVLAENIAHPVYMMDGLERFEHGKFDVSFIEEAYEAYSKRSYSLDSLVSDNIMNKGTYKNTVSVSGIKIVAYTMPTKTLPNGLTFTIDGTEYVVDKGVPVKSDNNNKVSTDVEKLKDYVFGTKGEPATETIGWDTEAGTKVFADVEISGESDLGTKVISGERASNSNYYTQIVELSKGQSLLARGSSDTKTSRLLVAVDKTDHKLCGYFAYGSGRYSQNVTICLNADGMLTMETTTGNGMYWVKDRVFDNIICYLTCHKNYITNDIILTTDVQNKVVAYESDLNSEISRLSNIIEQNSVKISELEERLKRLEPNS